MEKYTLDNFGGYEEEKIEAEKIINFLKNYDYYVSQGAYLPKGMLIYGQPGTGKTMLSKIISSEANVPLVTLDLKNSANFNLIDAINKVFDQALSKTPSVLLLDEIDQTVKMRRYGDATDRENDVLRTLLTRIDGINTSDGVFIIATSNVSSVEECDQALTRQGRIEKYISLHLPNIDERKEILKIYLNKNHIFDDVNVATLAKRTKGFSGSSIKSLINSVLIWALNEKVDNVSTDDFYQYIQQISHRGINKKKTSDTDLKATAYHELGHFICDYILNKNIGTISIETYGETAGAYRRVQDEERENTSYTALKNEITVALGGLAAVEVYLGEKYTGAASDIKKARGIYEEMLDNGMLGLDRLNEAPLRLRSIAVLSLSEEYLSREGKFMTECYQAATNIIKENKEIIDKLYPILVKNKIIFESKINEILKK